MNHSSVSATFMERHGFRLAWALAVLLSLPGLRAGPLLDDFMHRALLAGRSPGAAAEAWQLYDFSGVGQIGEWVARGHAPWHIHPDLGFRFFRPLSSLSLALDHWLFGSAMLPAHLVSFGLYLLLTGIAFRWHRLLLTRHQAAWAALLYVASSSHFMNTTWLASRHILLSAIFSALCVLLHVERRQAKGTGRKLPAGASPACLVLALLSGEAGLMAIAFIISYEWLGRNEAASERLKASLPCLLLGIAYVVFYVMAGYGPQNSGMYVSPLHAPVRFLHEGLLRAAILASEMAAGTPTFIANAAPQAIPVLLGVGALLTTFVVLLLSRTQAGQARRQMLWLGAGALLSISVCVGGIIEGRLLVLPLIGSTAVVGTAIASGLSKTPAWKGWLPKLMALSLCTTHVALAALIHGFAGEEMVKLSRAETSLAERFDDSQCPKGGHVLVLTASDPAIALSWVWSLAYHRPELLNKLPNFYLLSMAPHDQTLERTGSTTLTLTVNGLPRRSNMFEWVFRSDPVLAGTRVTWGALTAEVLETDQGLSTKTRFEIPENSCLVVLRDKQLVSLPLPDLQETLNIPYELGPFGM